MNSAPVFSEYGQSLWLDHGSGNPRSDQITAWIERGLVRGLTSSSGWVQGEHFQALLQTNALRLLAHAGLTSDDLLLGLIVEDARRIADDLLPIYERSNGEQGFLTVEIDLRSYPDQTAMLNSLLELWQRINRPNLLIGVPVSSETLPVFEAALVRGINVSASMLCSLEQYLAVLETYLRSLEMRLEKGESLEHIVSTAVFYVGDIDEHVNRRLGEYEGEGVEAKRAAALIDQTALAIAKLAYAQLNVSGDDDRFLRLAESGARMQRIVWSRFGQNHSQEPLNYIGALIGPNTVMAPSLKTIESLENGDIQTPTLEEGLSEARGKLQALEAIGLSMQQVAEQIMSTLIEERKAGYDAVLEAMESAIEALKAELGPAAAYYPDVLQSLIEIDSVRRVWQSDSSLWTDERRVAKQIETKFGWLDLPQHLDAIADEITVYTRDLRETGIQDLVVVTSGCVKALIEALLKDQGDSDSHLHVFDTAEKELALGWSKAVDPALTHIVCIPHQEQVELVVGSIESIGALLDGVDGRALAERGTIVSQGDALKRLKKSGYEFRDSFLIPEDLPYHYAVIGYPLFVAAAWMNRNLHTLQAGFSRMMNRCLPAVPIERNPGVGLASAITAAQQSGIKHLVVSGDTSWTGYCNWVVQFWEQAGLNTALEVELVCLDEVADLDSGEGKSALIYLSEGVQPAQQYGDMIDAGVPVIIIPLGKNPGSEGELVALFEFATALLGHVFRFNPFG